MAQIWITEYKNAVVVNGVGVPAGLEPALAVQSFSAVASTLSAPLNPETKFVRLRSKDGDFHYKVGADAGDSPTATTGDTPVGAGVAEYFGVPPVGVRIAFIEG